ncbi:MAG: hypothetical protein LUG56_01260 [Lachnospiraceae bacterium]|nr:hypothetical protein [Lachnospiraceae bacterium]
MGNNCQFLQACPLGFAQYPYTPERNLPYGTEEYLIELLDDGGTKFSVYDPDAKSIEIEFTDGEHRFALEKDSKDVWKLILYDIPAGLRYMKWYVNDVELINKKAPMIYGYGGAYNFVEIPEKGEDFYYLKDVPHGSLRLEYYNSGFTGEPHACVVYTPPSYDTHQERFYPVLYAQAGGGENETAWSQQGKINFILDNLIAEGKCREIRSMPEDRMEDTVMSNKLKFTVNGREYLFETGGNRAAASETGQIPATETLRETLNNRIEGIDLKRNCDRGICGGCTVLVDRRAVNACSILTVSCQDADILTLEGLSLKEYRLYELFRDSGYFEQHSAYISIRALTMICIAQFYQKENPADCDFEKVLSEYAGQGPGTEKILELIHQYRQMEGVL